MTVELDNVIKNLKGQVINLEVYQDGDNSAIYLSTDGNVTSGCEYKVQSLQDVADFVKSYLTNYYS